MDYIIILVAKVDVNVNPNEARDTRYVSPQELKDMFEQPGSLFHFTLLTCRFTIHSLVPFDLSKVLVRVVG